MKFAGQQYETLFYDSKSASILCPNIRLLSPYDINQGIKFIKLERFNAYKNFKMEKIFQTLFVNVPIYLMSFNHCPSSKGYNIKSLQKMPYPTLLLVW